MTSLCFQSTADESNTKHNGEVIEVHYNIYHSNTNGYFGRQTAYNSKTHSNCKIKQSPYDGEDDKAKHLFHMVPDCNVHIIMSVAANRAGWWNNIFRAGWRVNIHMNIILLLFSFLG